MLTKTNDEKYFKKLLYRVLIKLILFHKQYNPLLKQNNSP